MFFVYILLSQKTQRYYTGQAKDVAVRLLEHNSGKNKSTRHGIPWNVEHVEGFLTRSEAVA